jgi:hypothetical protein
MSQRRSWGRCTPRWSTDTAQAALGMALKAGLVDGMAIVCVDPPLLWRGPSLGFLPTLSVLILLNEHPAVFLIKL